MGTNSILLDYFEGKGFTLIGIGAREVSKWLSNEVKKLKEIKSNLIFKKICRLRNVQLQAIVNMMIYKQINTTYII